MKTSAFGVEHWESTEVFKAQSKKSKQRAKHYGQMGNTMAAMGATTAAVGTGSGIVGALERKGKDPMGFVSLKDHANSPKVKPAVRTRVLNANARAHFTQAKVAGGLTAASLGLAGAYKHAKKKEMSKSLKPSTKRKARDAAADTGTVAVGGAAIAGGGKMVGSLAPATKAHAPVAYYTHKAIREHKQGKHKLGPRQMKWAKNNRNVSARVAGVKGAGTVASLGIMGMGGKAIYDTGRKNAKEIM